MTFLLPETISVPSLSPVVGRKLQPLCFPHLAEALVLLKYLGEPLTLHLL